MPRTFRVIRDFSYPWDNLEDGDMITVEGVSAQAIHKAFRESGNPGAIEVNAVKIVNQIRYYAKVKENPLAPKSKGWVKEGLGRRISARNLLSAEPDWGTLANGDYIVDNQSTNYRNFRQNVGQLTVRASKIKDDLVPISWLRETPAFSKVILVPEEEFLRGSYDFIEAPLFGYSDIANDW